MFAAGTRTSVKNTSLNSCVPVICTIGLHLDARRAHVDDEVRDAGVRFGASGSVRASRMPHCATCASVVHTFWPFTTYSSPSRVARVGERREVAARARLAEELAPELGAVEEPGQPTLLLRLGARDEQRRARPSRSRSG